jgi:hypothetical protein
MAEQESRSPEFNHAVINSSAASDSDLRAFALDKLTDIKRNLLVVETVLKSADRDGISRILANLDSAELHTSDYLSS